jgi:hypothetical protein
LSSQAETFCSKSEKFERNILTLLSTSYNDFLLTELAINLYIIEDRDTTRRSVSSTVPPMGSMGGGGPPGESISLYPSNQRHFLQRRYLSNLTIQNCASWSSFWGVFQVPQKLHQVIPPSVQNRTICKFVREPCNPHATNRQAFLQCKRDICTKVAANPVQGPANVSHI